MKNILLTILLSLFAFSPVLAEDKLPDVMVGQTTVISSSNDKSVSFSNGQYARVDGLTGPSNDMTLAFKVKLNSVTGEYYNTAIRHNRLMGANNTNTTTGWAIGFNQNQIRLSVGNGTSAINSVLSAQTFNLGEWTDVILRRTGSEFRVYKNGSSVGTVSLSGSVFQSGQPLIMGDNDGSTGVSSVLNIDCVSIYSRSFSDTEVINYSFGSPSDRLGSWDFNGVAGNTIPDLSGNNHPGTIVGAVLTEGALGTTKTYYGGYTGNEAILNYNSSGKATGTSLAPSAVFNGTSNYVDAGKSPIISGRGSFAVSLWFKRNGTTGSNQMLMTQMSMPHCSDFFLWIVRENNATNANKIYFRTYGPNNELGGAPNASGEIYSGATIAPTDSSWHHVVAQRISNGTTWQHALWLDGVSVGSSTQTDAVWLNNTGTNWLASNSPRVAVGAIPTDLRDTWNPADYFKGNISTARLYNGSLTSPEITALFNESSSAPTTNLKLHLKLSDNSSTIKDYSTNNYSGITFNGTWSDDGPLPNPESSDLLGFSKDTLLNCANNGMIPDPARCFTLNANPTGMKLMTSRTYVNYNPIIEVAALRYPDKTVIGDVYGTLNNFAFWGKSANQGAGVTSSNSDAAYRIGYAINPNAQASLSGEQYQSYVNKIKEFAGEAQSITNNTQLSAPAEWYLQGSTSIIESNNSDKTKYPEGKIWSVEGSGGTFNLTANKTYTYHGKGTLIIRNPSGAGDDLNFLSGTKLIPADNDSRLGIILMDGNDVTFSGNNKIEAAILCYTDAASGGTFTVNGSNSDFTGSFVARTFAGMGGSSIRFYYDYAFDGAWPPGFKYLNMPHAEVK